MTTQSGNVPAVVGPSDTAANADLIGHPPLRLEDGIDDSLATSEGAR